MYDQFTPFATALLEEQMYTRQGVPLEKLCQRSNSFRHLAPIWKDIVRVSPREFVSALSSFVPPPYFIQGYAREGDKEFLPRDEFEFATKI